VIKAFTKEVKTKDETIKILEAENTAQARNLKETSLSHAKELKGYESRIRNLETYIRRLDESKEQTLDAKDQVVHTHIYIQTLLHKTQSYLTRC
jgi:ribosomal protein S30